MTFRSAVFTCTRPWASVGHGQLNGLVAFEAKDRGGVEVVQARGFKPQPPAARKAPHDNV